MADNQDEAQEQEKKEKLERNKYVLSLAKQNLSVVIDQIESIDTEEYGPILEALHGVSTDITKALA